MTQAADYALQATIYLARRQEGERVTAAYIAEALAIPRNYLSKILYALAQAGVLDSTRGPRGGFRLGMKPGDISLARVIEPFTMPGDTEAAMKDTTIEMLLQAAQRQTTNRRFL